MLTPVEVSGKEFTRALNGYNRQEVDDFLNKVSDHLEGLIRESDFIKTQVIEGEKKLTDYQNQENSLKDALLVAQITASDIKKKAELEAETLVNKAKEEAKDLLEASRQESDAMLEKARLDVEKNLEQAKQDYKEIQNATKSLKRDYQDFKEKYQHILREQIHVLDRIDVKDELTD